MDFERASINAFAETFPASSVAGCIFHLGQSLYRKVQQIGLSGKYQVDEDFRLRVKTLSALAFLPLEEIVEGYELIEQRFPDDEQEFLAYFESTYIGRRIPAGRRRPLFEHHLWSVEHRMTLGSLRTNNAIESFHRAFAQGIAQQDHPPVYRFLESLQLQQNIACGAINIAPHNPTDREIAEFEDGGQKQVEKRQMERNARISNISVRYADHGDKERLLRGIAWNYM